VIDINGTTYYEAGPKLERTARTYAYSADSCTIFNSHHRAHWCNNFGASTFTALLIDTLLLSAIHSRAHLIRLLCSELPGRRTLQLSLGVLSSSLYSYTY
jgi:hypothetical protein